MSWPDITPEDNARWPDETRVLIDVLLEHGVKVEVYGPDDCGAVLYIKQHYLAPYRLRQEYGGLRFYSSSDAIGQATFDDVETFDCKQRVTVEPISLALTPPRGFTYMGDEETARAGQIIIHATTDGDNWFQLSPERAPLYGLTYTAESPVSMTRFGPRRRFQEKPSRVPEKLQKKRLDGRR